MNKIIATIAVFVFAFAASARTVNINLGAHVGKDVTAMLRTQLTPLSPNDHAIITLSKKGAYYLSGTVVAKCNVTLSGCGAKSKFILCNGNNSTAFKAFTDDTFLEFIGTKRHPISVDIHNLGIHLQEHTGFWWFNGPNGKREAKFAVKIYHAQSVNVDRVNSTLKNAICTNFNLRVCSNVNFSNCILTNYNNCSEGGIIWIEGATSNVNITNNVINKYGNDEAIGIYGSHQEINNGRITFGNTSKNNINISNNVFNYGYNGKDKEHVMNDVLISLFTNGYDDGNICSMEDLVFSNNKLNISDPMRITMQFRIDKTDTYHGCVVDNNSFLNTYGNSGGEQFYKTDIKITDKSDFSRQPAIEINNNSFVNESALLTRWGSTGLSHIQLAGGNVMFAENSTNDEQAFADKKGGILAYITGASTLNLEANSAAGLAMIGCISDAGGVGNVEINASNNLFEGITTIYSDKVQQLDVNFSNNTFKSNNMNFFLQEFAKEGTVVFNHNDVSVKGGGGQLMTHWANTNAMDMRFNSVEVIGNSFFGVDNAQKMLINMQNVGQKTIRNNSFSK